MKLETRSRAHIVYRCYDADNRLVYVGMTSTTMARRMLGHAHRNPDVHAATKRVETTAFPNRASAAEAESRAIDREHPLLNVRRGAVYTSTFEELRAAINLLGDADDSVTLCLDGGAA